MKQIYVLGSTAVDISISEQSGEVTASLGGKGSNQAIAASRSGEPVKLASKVGADLFGKSALEFWRGENIDTSCCIVSNEYPTGLTAVMLDSLGNGRSDTKMIRGKNAAKFMSDSDLEVFASGFPDSGIFMTQLSSTPGVVFEMIKRAKRAGLMVILDTAPVIPVPERIWEYVDIIIPNRYEADELGSVPVPTKVITLGSLGVRVVADGIDEIIPAHAVDAIDSTGAGDSFGGAFAAALLKGADIIEAARFGNAAGAICASRRGAADAIPYCDEIERLLNIGKDNSI